MVAEICENITVGRDNFTLVISCRSSTEARILSKLLTEESERQRLHSRSESETAAELTKRVGQ